MNNLPNSKEAELAVIGSVLIEPSIFREIDLTPDDFFYGSAKEIWKIFQELTFQKKGIDILTVQERAAEKGLQSSVTVSYLIQATAETPTSLNAKHYAGIVKDKAKRREYIRLAGELATTAYDEKNIIDEHIPGFLNKIINSSRPEHSSNHIADTLSVLYDQIQERIADPKEIYGLETGIRGLDRITGGLQKGEVFLMSGEPGLGKSLLSIQLGFSMAKNGHAGAIYEMEMSAIQTLRRTLSVESNVQVSSMKSGKVVDSEHDSLAKAFDRLNALKVYLSDSTSWTTASMRADLTRLKMQNNIEWFVVDYLRLLKDRYGKDDYERLAYIGSSIHDIAKDLNLAGLLIHSMNKQGVNGQISMGSLSGSAQISYDVDTIAILEKDKDPNIVTMRFEKLREGDGDSRILKLAKKAGYPHFLEAEMTRPQFSR